nr:ATP synthase F0 subunit 8 [Ovalona pulchella]
MPQSWPSQWTILFILFIFSFFLVVVLTYFVSSKHVLGKSSFSCSTPVLNWQW